MVERNPDYKSLLIEYFPNLRELDQVNLQQIKQQIKIGKQLKRLIIPFMYRIDKVVQNLAHKIDSFSDEHPQEQRNKLILLRDEFDIIFQLKDFNQMKAQAKTLLNHIELINGKLLEKGPKQYMPESRNELYLLYKWLFQEMLIRSSSSNSIRSNDITKYLNQQILLKNPDLFNYLKHKHQIKDPQFSRELERCIDLLQQDDSINFDTLINEQLKEFYRIQPLQSTLSEQFYIIEKNDLGEQNRKEISFGNRAMLGGLQNGGKEYDLHLYSSSNFEEGNSTSKDVLSGDFRSVDTDDLQLALEGPRNPFFIKDIASEAIIPGAQLQHQEMVEENALNMKVPEGILKQSEPDIDIIPRSSDHLLSIFKESNPSDIYLNENKSKKVDFNISSYQDNMSHSVFDSQLQSSRHKKSPNANHYDSIGSQIVLTDRSQTIGGLAKFLVKNGQNLIDSETQNSMQKSMMDKLLIEFPVFALNDDYLRAISLIIQGKIDEIKGMVEDRQFQIDQIIQQAVNRAEEEKYNNIINQPQVQQQQPFHALDPISEQLKEHRVLSDGNQLDQWIGKQHGLQIKLHAINQLSQAIQQTLVRNHKLNVFNDITSFSKSLIEREQKVAMNLRRRTRKKIFFRWFDGYYSNLETTYRTYTRKLKFKAIKSLMLLTRYAKLKNIQAQQKLRNNIISKTWLSILQNTNQLKKDKAHALRVRQSVKDKNFVGNHVNVNPVLDKILPDERKDMMRFYAVQTQKENEDAVNYRVSNPNDYIYEDKSSEVSGLQRGGTMQHNPFKTLQNDVNTQSEQVLLNQASLDYVPLRRDTDNSRLLTVEKQGTEQLEQMPQILSKLDNYKDRRSNSKDKRGSRNETAKEFKDKFFSFGGRQMENTNKSSNKSLNRVRFEEVPDQIAQKQVQSQSSPGMNVSTQRSFIQSADKRAPTPGFISEAVSPQVGTNKLMQLNFDKKDKQISGYFSRQINFQSTKPQKKVNVEGSASPYRGEIFQITDNSIDNSQSAYSIQTDKPPMHNLPPKPTSKKTLKSSKPLQSDRQLTKNSSSAGWLQRDASGHLNQTNKSGSNLHDSFSKRHLPYQSQNQNQSMNRPQSSFHSSNQDSFQQLMNQAGQLQNTINGSSKIRTTKVFKRSGSQSSINRQILSNNQTSISNRVRFS